MNMPMTSRHSGNDGGSREIPQQGARAKKTPFDRLPTEIQARVAFWVSMRRPGHHRKVSMDLGDFRLVCHHFADLGAQVLARERLVNRRSSYRGIAIDFTIRRLLQIEALVKNPTLAAAITNVYLVKWQLRASSIADSRAHIMEELAMRSHRNANDEQMWDRYVQRQEFFKDRRLLVRLVAAIDSLPNVQNVKWIEDTWVHLPTNYPQNNSDEEEGDVGSTRRSRRPLPSVSPLPRDLAWHDRSGDSFHRMVTQWSYFNKMIGSLRALMANLTHLHIRSVSVPREWQEDDDYSTTLWGELAQAAQNITCFQFNTDGLTEELVNSILRNVTWPRLRKVYFNDGLDDVRPNNLLEPFLLRHRNTLVKVRLPRRRLSPNTSLADANFIKLEWWRDNFKEVTKVIRNTPSETISYNPHTI